MESLEQNQLVVVSKKKTLLAVYGTLRLGKSNWSRYLRDRSEHLGTFKTEPAFTMYGKGAGFPVVVDEGDTSIEYDLFSVEDEDVVRRINNLEGCTGIPGDKNNWYDITSINTPKGEASMYIMHVGRNEGSIIESGNWNNQ